MIWNTTFHHHFAQGQLPNHKINHKRLKGGDFADANLHRPTR